MAPGAAPRPRAEQRAFGRRVRFVVFLVAVAAGLVAGCGGRSSDGSAAATEYLDLVLNDFLDSKAPEQQMVLAPDWDAVDVSCAGTTRADRYSCSAMVESDRPCSGDFVCGTLGPNAGSRWRFVVTCEPGGDRCAWAVPSPRSTRSVVRQLEQVGITVTFERELERCSASSSRCVDYRCRQAGARAHQLFRCQVTEVSGPEDSRVTTYTVICNGGGQRCFFQIYEYY